VFLMLVGFAETRAQGSGAVPAAMATRGQQTVFACPDGSVWGVGVNENGSLGDGTRMGRLGAVRMQSATIPLAGAVDVACGNDHTAVLKADGTVWTAGLNSSGQLGNGNTTSQFRAVQVLTSAGPLTGVRAIAAGSSHTLALTKSGEVWSWGLNTSGQLGTGNTTNQNRAVKVASLPAVAAVSAGDQFSYAVAIDGTVWAFGDNSHGQLGNNSTVAISSTPVRVRTASGNLSAICEAAGGAAHGAFLSLNGTVWTAGLNSSGQLSTGTTTSSRVAQQALRLAGPLGGVSQVACSDNTTFFLLTSGKVLAAGDNTSGQVGDGTRASRSAAVLVSGLDGVSFLSAGADRCFAVITDGSIFAWGGDLHGAQARGERGLEWGWNSMPAWSPFFRVAMGVGHNLYLKSDGRVWAAGRNTFGQLGNGLAADSLFPVQVQSATGGLNGIQDVAAGRAHSLALGQNGTVWAWGLNLNGRLGDGTLINRSKAVMTHDAVGPLSGATAVVAGDGFNLALRQGAVWAWGANDKHQLGDGTAIDRNKAVRVMTASGGLAGVKAVAAGANHGVALAGNGSVWVWGSNSQGQLGLGNTINQSRAVTIPGVSDALAVGAGTAQTYILRSTGGGTVWGAGQNNFGQLADGTTTNRSGLVRVQDLTGPLTGLTWLKTGALAQQAAAGRLDGSSWIWGSNDTGQLGTGSLANALRAIRLPEGIQPQSLGTGATFARRADFEWVASGSFFDGQWGDGRKGYHATPTLVRGMTFARPAPDTDADGLADWREIAQGTSVVKSDTDGDGIGDASDILPIDYFNGAPVALAMASGNQQTGKPGTRLAKPIVVVVSRYGTPLSNAPVTFSVTSGGLAADGNGTVLLGQLQVRTNAAGQAIVFYTLPAMERTCSISIHAGNARTTAIATASWIPATPALSLPGGTFATQRWVVATSATPDARIHYTLDGKEPTSASPHIANGQATLVDRAATLKVRAIATSGHSSPVVSGSFQITGMVSAGAFHMAGLCTDGTVWAWGNNGSGQVGAGLGGKYPVPFRKNGIANGRHLSCGGYHTLVLLENGEVVSFGRNHEGQLGHSAEGESVVPGLQGIQTVAAGGYHSLALKSDGTVWAWGANWFGQLGDGSTQSRALPVPVRDATGQPLRKVAALAAGSYSSYALLEDGTLLAWGGNWNGQLGDGSQENRTFPVRVGKLEGVTRVAAGWEHAAAVKSNGTVWCWGDGASGQIGGDSFQMGAVTTPVQAAGITTARLVAAGSSHTLALLSDGSLRAWGNNFSGQLGSGVSSVTSIRSTPQKTVFEGGVVDVSAGGFDSMALLADGTLRTFGYNEFGQLGAGDLQAKPYAFASQARAGVAGVSAGKSHSAIRFADGRAGWFGFYETGNRHIGGEDPDDQRHQARVFDALTGVRQVASGHNHSLALKNDGTVWAWGMGGQGQLGTGHTGPSMEPVQVPGMNGVVWVSAAGNSSLAVKADGSVCTWGENSSGQLGDGTQLSRWHPTTVVGLSGILQAELSPSHGVAVSGNGTVHIWGNNESANLSAEAARAVLPPRVVPNLSAVAVAAGEGFTLALAADGTVRSWGANQAGQLGLGDALLRGTPTLVPNVAAIVQVVAKGRFAMALKQDGTALAWGQNGFGQLGDGTLVDRPSPVPVANLDSVGELAAGANQSFAVLKNGTLRAWGNNGKVRVQDIGNGSGSRHR
jgi:alpha-tubulin suppressor-like RCC1 family protein